MICMLQRSSCNHTKHPQKRRRVSSGAADLVKMLSLVDGVAGRVSGEHQPKLPSCQRFAASLILASRVESSDGELKFSQDHLLNNLAKTLTVSQ